MATRFGVIAENLFTDVVTTQKLIENIPGISDVVEGAAHLRSMKHEIDKLGWFARRGVTLKHVGKIDAYLQTFLEHAHQDTCDCGKPLWGSDASGGNHKEWFFVWQARYGKAFQVEDD